MTDAPHSFSPAFQRLLNRHALNATIRQIRFGTFVGSRHYVSSSTTPDTLRFQDDLELPAQVLGFASAIDSTWNWAWAGMASGVSRSALSASLRLKEYGELREVPELNEAYRRLAAADIFVHIVGTVAVGLLDAAGYYVGTHEDRDILLLVPSCDHVDRGMPGLDETATVYQDLLTTVPLNSRETLIAFLETWQLPFEEPRKGEIRSRWPAAEHADPQAAPSEMITEFDEWDRLIKLTFR